MKETSRDLLFLLGNKNKTCVYCRMFLDEYITEYLHFHSLGALLSDPYSELWHFSFTANAKRGTPFHFVVSLEQRKEGICYGRPLAVTKAVKEAVGRIPISKVTSPVMFVGSLERRTTETKVLIDGLSTTELRKFCGIGPKKQE